MSIIKCGGVLVDLVIDGSDVVRAALSSVYWVGEDEGASSVLAFVQFDNLTEYRCLP
jgi:hypothetical protein